MTCLYQPTNSFSLPLKYGSLGMNNFPIFGVISWIEDGDLIGSSRKDIIAVLASYADITSATALTINAKSLLGERER